MRKHKDPRIELKNDLDYLLFCCMDQWDYIEDVQDIPAHEFEDAVDDLPF